MNYRNLCDKDKTKFSNVELEFDIIDNWNKFSSLKKLVSLFIKLSFDNYLSVVYDSLPDKLTLHFTCYLSENSWLDELNWHLHHYIQYKYGLISTDFPKQDAEICEEIVTSYEMIEILSLVLSSSGASVLINDPSHEEIDYSSLGTAVGTGLTEFTTKLAEFAVINNLNFNLNTKNTEFLNTYRVNNRKSNDSGLVLAKYFVKNVDKNYWLKDTSSIRIKGRLQQLREDNNVLNVESKNLYPKSIIVCYDAFAFRSEKNMHEHIVLPTVSHFKDKHGVLLDPEPIVFGDETVRTYSSAGLISDDLAPLMLNHIYN